MRAMIGDRDITLALGFGVAALLYLLSSPARRPAVPASLVALGAMACGKFGLKDASIPLLLLGVVGVALSALLFRAMNGAKKP
jgi:hypothetical protein